MTWHSLLSVVAVFVAYFLFERWVRRAGLSAEIAVNIGPWGIAGGIIGARVVHVIDEWGYYSANPLQILAVWNGGVAIYGAIAGGVIAGCIYAWRKGYPVRKLMDIIAPALIFAQAIGRLGDIINGEHFSTPTSLPWSVIYTNPQSPGYGRPPSHPAVAYELLADLAIFGVLWLLRDRLKPDGARFTVYAALYALIRFPLSFLRLDSHSVLFGINQQGYLSIIVFAWAVAALIAMHASFKKPALVTPPPARPGPNTPRSRKT